MPKAKPVSLPFGSFEEAIRALIRVDPEKVGLVKKKKRKAKRKRKR